MLDLEVGSKRRRAEDSTDPQVADAGAGKEDGVGGYAWPWWKCELCSEPMLAPVTPACGHSACLECLVVDRQVACSLCDEPLPPPDRLVVDESLKARVLSAVPDLCMARRHSRASDLLEYGPFHFWLACNRGDQEEVALILSAAASSRHSVSNLVHAPRPDGYPCGTGGGSAADAAPDRVLPLAAAARGGHLGVCELLLASGAHPDGSAPRGTPGDGPEGGDAARPVLLAAEAGHTSVVQLLIGAGALPP